jgi:hypothetical protein
MVLLAMTLQMGVASAASFDGHWTGHLDHGFPNGGGGGRSINCSQVNVVLDLTIANGEVKGIAAAGGNQSPLQGAVSADGKLSATAGGSSMSGQFSGDAFAGDWQGQLCTFKVSLQKAQ